ncbi:MAG TPA: hypothetical protein VK779_04745 [Rhizomicrobium sp.]|nr:hypothetical protein [Rhizomicrobium sp.]
MKRIAISALGFGAVLLATSAMADEGMFDTAFGTPFIAANGTMLTLTPSEDGMTLRTGDAHGIAKTVSFQFYDDTSGIVTDENMGGRFRIVNHAIYIRFDDGRLEKIAPSVTGELQVFTKAAGSSNFECTAWYPRGHRFSANDIGCVTPPMPASALKSPVIQASIPKSTLAPLQAVVVNASVVHTIDEPMVANPVISGSAALAAPQSFALPPKQTVTDDMQPNVNAADCLSVETNGTHWGFRNRCGFDVQFAYCVAGSNSRLTSCADGAVTGSVSPHGFGALMADTSIGDKSADHDFRWIACNGGAGEVVPHLDRSDPPRGRCLRSS